MKIVSLYSTLLSNDNLVYALKAGNHRLNMTLYWPVVEQEQWDIVMRRVAQMSSSDPIITKERTVVSRTYDYVAYYTESVPRQMVDREAWWEQQDTAPQSLIGKTYEQIAGILEERVTLCQGIAMYLEELSEALCYQVTIIDEERRVITGTLRPGAWINNRDTSWALRFVADIENIARDRLDIVTVEVEAYNE